MDKKGIMKLVTAIIVIGFLLGTNLLTLLRVNRIQTQLNSLTIKKEVINKTDSVINVTDTIVDTKTVVKYKNIIKKDTVEKVVTQIDTVYIEKSVNEFPSFIRTVKYDSKNISILNMDMLSDYLSRNEIYNLFWDNGRYRLESGEIEFFTRKNTKLLTKYETNKLRKQ